MALLPEGFVLPPLAHLAVLLLGSALVGWGIARRRPPVTERVVLGFVPWMLAGAALHVLYVVGALPGSVDPFGSAPAVYVSVAVLAGVAWLLADDALDGPTVSTAVAATGTLSFLLAAAAAVVVGASRGTLTAFWPGVGALVAVALGAATWTVLTRVAPETRVTGGVGALAVVGHALDGVSTAVGVDVLHFGERTPLSQVILEFAGSLPTADLLGSGWLFVLVKLVVASAVVALVADYVREEPAEGYLLLGFVAAVGLGPGVHNLLLFAVG